MTGEIKALGKNLLEKRKGQKCNHQDYYQIRSRWTVESTLYQ